MKYLKLLGRVLLALLATWIIRAFFSWWLFNFGKFRDGTVELIGIVLFISIWVFAMWAILVVRKRQLNYIMKKKIILIIVAIALLVGAGYLLIPKRGEQTNKDFLRTLKGEVVYQHRNGGDFNIYKISANGNNKILLYKNSFPSSSNRNVMNPKWSEDGSKIFFAVMPGNTYWNSFSMNSDGSNVKQETTYGRNSGDAGYLDKLHEFLGTKDLSNEKDIVVEMGSIYFVDSNGVRNLVYKHQNYNGYSNPGASEASWSPDKNYVIFMLNEHGSNEIMIVSKDGTNLAKLANGHDPDWKY